MQHVLVTGVTGFIGRALVTSLSESHHVMGISRNPAEDTVMCVHGEFGSFEDLHQFDDQPIDAVVHLAAVTGMGKERELLETNVLGTRNLLRYAIGRGCRRFVLASSIAVVGIQDIAFHPDHLPMRDRHPCLDGCGYGFTKHLMEQTADYFARQIDDLTIVSLRIASIFDEATSPSLIVPGPAVAWATGAVTMMSRRDVVRAITLALDAKLPTGHHVYNTVSPFAWASVPTAEILHSWYGDEYDASYYEQPEHRWDALFDCTAICDELGFAAEDLPPTDSRA